MNKLFLALGLVVVFAAAIACVPGDDNSGGSGDVKLVPAPIDDLDILVRESAPPGYTLHIKSGLPSGCAKFVRAEITGRSDSTVTVEVLNSMPADDDIACTMIYGTHETNLDLGTDFVPGRTYTVAVNDEQTTFVAQ